MKVSKVMSVFCPKRMDRLRDMMTWHLCYEQGLRPPRYPVPVDLQDERLKDYLNWYNTEGYW